MMQASTSLKKYVTSGPHLWVAALLHQKGPLTTKAIWEEYEKDKTVEEGLIKSKTKLKNEILRLMHLQNKLIRAPTPDVPDYKRAGWKVNRTKAFKHVDPEILAKMQPIPHLMRKDLREYCEKNEIEYPNKEQLKRKVMEEQKEVLKYLETYEKKK